MSGTITYPPPLSIMTIPKNADIMNVISRDEYSLETDLLLPLNCEKALLTHRCLLFSS
jgi:hypothetical protein